MKVVSRLIKRAELALAILFLRWEISQWNYGLDQRSDAERIEIYVDQSIREIKLMILRMEYNNI